MLKSCVKILYFFQAQNGAKYQSTFLGNNCQVKILELPSGIINFAM